MAKIKYDPLPHQELFHDSGRPKVYLSAGYGAGKTHALVMKMFQLCSLNSGLPGGLLVPDLKMFKRDVLPMVRDICAENEIEMSFNKQDSSFHFPETGSTILVFHSEDDGASIRGPNLAFGLINEVTLCTEGAFKAFLARIRLKSAPARQLAMSGTPEGFGWAYRYFFEDPRQDTDLIFGDTRANTHVAEDYVQMLLNSYDEKMIQQYVEGKFVNLIGNQAAYAFDRKKHIDKALEINKDEPIWVSLDFNVSPMAATIWNKAPAGSKVILKAVDEICLNSSNTMELCETLKQRLPFRDPSQIVIYPDPAGRASSTKSHFSDFDILRNAGFTQMKFKGQVSVRDCMNALNAMLSRNEIMVSHKCKNLIADLEQCTLKESDTFEIDKKDPRRSHWLDGAKNMVDYEFPVFKPAQLRVQKYA